MNEFKIPPGSDINQSLKLIVDRINEIERKVIVQENEDIINSIRSFCTCDALYTGIHINTCILFGSPVRK